MAKNQSINEFLEIPKMAGIELGYFNEWDAFVAWANETGYGNRPARPFLRPVLDSSEWRDFQNEQTKRFFLGEIDKDELGKKLYGEFKTLLSRYIHNPYNFKPNALATILIKGSDTPLLVDGKTRFIEALEVRENS